MSKGNILLFSNPQSRLVKERSKIPILGGYKVYWFCWSKKKSHHLSDANWLTGVITPPSVRRGCRPLVFLTLLWTFLRLQPCIIHVHYALSGWFRAKLLGCLHPLVVSTMGGDIMSDQGFHGDFVEPTSHLLKKADVITSKSEFMDSRLLEIGQYMSKIRRITWGIDFSRYKPGLDTTHLRKQWNIKSSDFVLFCARVSEPRTNKDIVVRAFAKCVAESRPVKLLISEYLGDPEYCAGIRKLVTQYGIEDHICFVGDIPQTEMPEYMNLADAVISVPISDGLPQTVFQAMACAAYPIVSDIPEMSIFNKLKCEMGMTKVGDIVSLANEMKIAINNKTKIAEMGLRNRERILEIADKEEQNKAMIAIYDELLPKTLKRRLRL